MNKQYPPIYIVGPTASGKSKLAVMLAKRIGGVVISADSMQIYRGLDVGTAKITAEEAQGVEHKLIDVVDKFSEFSVAEFKEMAQKEISLAQRAGKYPIVVGGTGLYFEALIYPMSFASTSKNSDIRKYLEDFCEQNGKEALHETLRFFDPIRAEKLHQNDVKRVIRALEIILSDGKQCDEIDGEEPDVIMIGLTDDRQKLYDRIDRRVDEMFEKGLVDEVLNVGRFDYQSMQAIGYKEFSELEFDVIDGKKVPNKASLDDVKAKIKQHTRNYAKRQLTWFKRYKSATWFDFEHADDAINYAISRLETQNS